MKNLKIFVLILITAITLVFLGQAALIGCNSDSEESTGRTVADDDDDTAYMPDDDDAGDDDDDTEDDDESDDDDFDDDDDDTVPPPDYPNDHNNQWACYKCHPVHTSENYIAPDDCLGCHVMGDEESTPRRGLPNNHTGVFEVLHQDCRSCHGDEHLSDYSNDMCKTCHKKGGPM